MGTSRRRVLFVLLALGLATCGRSRPSPTLVAEAQAPADNCPNPAFQIFQAPWDPCKLPPPYDPPTVDPEDAGLQNCEHVLSQMDGETSLIDDIHSRNHALADEERRQQENDAEAAAEEDRLQEAYDSQYLAALLQWLWGLITKIIGAIWQLVLGTFGMLGPGDLHVAGPETIRYDSTMNVYDGPFGANVDSSLFERLLFEGSDVIYWCPGNAQKYRFDRVGSSDTFSGEGRTQGRRIEYAPAAGTYTLVDRYGQRTVFDDGGRIQARIDLAGNDRTFQYDTNGRLTTARDATGRVIYSLAYFPSGRVETLAIVGTFTIGFSYDADGNLTRVHTPTTAEHPGGRDLHFEYSSGFGDEDLNHNLTRAADADGVTIMSYAHDTDDRVTSISAGNCTTTISYQPPVAGVYRNIVTDPRGVQREYVFTPSSGSQVAQRIIHANNPPLCEGSPVSWTYSYTYDAAERLTSVLYPSGRRLDITRDAQGNMTERRWRTTNTTQNAPTDFVESYTYDSGNLPTSFTNIGGQTHTFAWNSQGKMTSFGYPTVTKHGDPQQASSTYAWNGDGTLQSWTNPVGTKATYTRDPVTRKTSGVRLEGAGGAQPAEYTLQRNAVGQLTSLTTPCGLQTTLTYDAYDLTGGSDSLGRARTWGRDVRGRVREIRAVNKDENGVPDPDLPEVVWSQSFNPIGATASTSVTRSSTSTLTTTYERDPAGNVTALVTPAGRRKEVRYDERGLPCSLTRGAGTPLAETTTLSWDLDGRIAQITDPGGRQWQYEHTGQGLLSKTIAPNGAYVERVYGTGRQVDSIGIYDATDTLHQKRSLLYDERNRVYQVEDDIFGPGLTPSVATSRVFLDMAGRSTKSVDASGAEVERDFNWRAQPTQLRFPSQAVRDLVYDDGGNVLSSTVQDGTKSARVSVSYDAARRPVTVSHEDTQNPGTSRTVTYEYDSLDRVRVFTDASGEVARYTYDGTDQLTSLTREIRNAAGQVVATETEDAFYDPDGLPVELKDAKGNSTLFAHDALGRPTQIQFANGDTFQSSYNTDGTAASQTDANGTVVTYSYDGAGQLTGLNVAPAPGVVGPTAISFGRDGVGRIISATDGAFSVSRSLDSLGRALSETQGTWSVQRAWDARGTITGLIYPGGTNLAFQRDGEARLTSITQGGSTLLSQTWNAAEGRTSRSFGTGVAEAYGYTGFQQITSIAVTQGALQHARFDYGYTTPGLPGYEARGHRGGTGPVYGYDSDVQLTTVLRGVTNPAQEFANPGTQTWTTSIAYGFDPAKNRTAVTTTPFGGAPTTVLSTVNSAQQVVSSGGTARVHDANGNLIDDGTYLYKYDFRNLLHQVQRKSDGALIASYGYDPLGRRVRKTVGASVTQYVYDGLRVAEERDGAGNLQRAWVYGDGLDDATHMLTPTATYALHKDRLGSVVAVTDSTGALVETVDYDEVGNPSFFGPTGQPLAGSTIGNPVLFTGQRLDTETGLYHYKARAYDPAHGRFLQRDPLLYINGLNPYLYVGNSPTFLVDPLGLFEVTGWDWLDRKLNWVAEKRDAVLGVERADRLRQNVATTLGNAQQAVRESEVVDAVQTGLDAAGMVPVVGEVADGLSGAISLAEGDLAGAALSAGAMIPGAGNAAGAAKLARRADQCMDAIDTASDIARAASKAGDETFEILDGVRRSKAADLVGNSTVPAEIIDSQGRQLGKADLPIDSLRSPKSSIDISTNSAADRFFKNNLEPAKAGSVPPPIMVTPGNRGTRIKDVTLDTGGGS